MKQTLLLLTGILFFNLSVFSQAKRNFQYLESIYTISIDTPGAGKTKFRICNQVDTCQTSPNLLWPFQEEIFQSKFKSLLMAIDPTNSETAQAEQTAIVKSLSEWYAKQYTPPPSNPSATVRTGLSVAAAKPSDGTKIGVLILRPGSFRLYRKEWTVKEVRLTIENGVIPKKALYIIMDDGHVFFNKKAPINFPRFFKRKEDLLQTWQGLDTATILLKYILEYIPFGKLYYPEDKEITLTHEPEKDRDTLVVSSSLNNMLEVNVYTDLLGILGDKPNGLIQTEVSGHFVSNTGNIANADITFHNFMRPYFRLSRFDSKYRSLDTNSIRKGPQGDTLDRTYMTQISYLQAGLKINIVRFGLGINQVLYLNAGGDVNLANADSVYRKDITFFNYFGEINYTITRLKNFGMDATLKWTRQYLSSANNDIVKITNRGKESFFSPTFNLYYFPTSDAASRIYFRFAYVANTKEGRSNYTQFQVGYRTNLNF